jgi:cytidylate kinase
MSEIVVTIDGPAGAGKSTVAKGLAAELGYRLLDTGALYRAVALCAERRGVSWDAAEALGELAAGLDVRFELDGDLNRVFLEGDDVSEAIRTPDVSRGASIVSAHPPVRAGLMDLQRRLGADGGVVVEGRDTGTVVFPTAGAKFFLTASAETRARRRCDELLAKGAQVDYEATLAEIIERDDRDSNRAVAPLTQADDAVLVDSSDIGAPEVIAQMASEVRRRRGSSEG